MYQIGYSFSENKINLHQLYGYNPVNAVFVYIDIDTVPSENIVSMSLKFENIKFINSNSFMFNELHKFLRNGDNFNNSGLTITSFINTIIFKYMTYQTSIKGVTLSDLSDTIYAYDKQGLTNIPLSKVSDDNKCIMFRIDSDNSIILYLVSNCSEIISNHTNQLIQLSDDSYRNKTIISPTNVLYTQPIDIIKLGDIDEFQDYEKLNKLAFEHELHQNKVINNFEMYKTQIELLISAYNIVDYYNHRNNVVPNIITQAQTMLENIQSELNVKII